MNTLGQRNLVDWVRRARPGSTCRRPRAGAAQENAPGGHPCGSSAGCYLSARSGCGPGARLFTCLAYAFPTSLSAASKAASKLRRGLQSPYPRSTMARAVVSIAISSAAELAYTACEPP